MGSIPVEAAVGVEVAASWRFLVGYWVDDMSRMSCVAPAIWCQQIANILM